MLRIVYIQIPEQMFELAYECRQSTLELLTKQTDLAPLPGVYRSAHMATTSADFFACEQLMRSIWGDPPHLFVNVTKDYRLFRTRAEQSYDYGYVIEIGTVPGENGSSGLRSAVDCS